MDGGGFGSPSNLLLPSKSSELQKSCAAGATGNRPRRLNRAVVQFPQFHLGSTATTMAAAFDKLNRSRSPFTPRFLLRIHDFSFGMMHLRFLYSFSFFLFFYCPRPAIYALRSPPQSIRPRSVYRRQLRYLFQGRCRGRGGGWPRRRPHVPQAHHHWHQCLFPGARWTLRSGDPSHYDLFSVHCSKPRFQFLPWRKPKEFVRFRT